MNTELNGLTKIQDLSIMTVSQWIQEYRCLTPGASEEEAWAQLKELYRKRVIKTVSDLA